MVRRVGIFLMSLLPLVTVAQEVLTPLQKVPVQHSAVASKSLPDALLLPFFDDFATGRLDSGLWQQGGAMASFDVSPLAPTVGVMTLDALDGEGKLYPNASTSLFHADTVTSQPIRLDSFAPADSVVLSFYYLPGGGNGNMWERMGFAPDRQDSLFLDFYNAADTSWHMVWFTAGTCVDTLLARTGRDWQYVAVSVTDSGCFDSIFRFRFRNYASLEMTPKPGEAGNCDYWHIDYVLMDTGRSVMTEEVMRDIAFAAPAPTLLRDYRAMPYRQYTAGDMASSVQLKITNRYSSQLASHYFYCVLDDGNNEVHNYDGGYLNAPPFMPDGTYQAAQAHAQPPVNYSFPPMTAPATYTVVHVVHEGAAGDDYTANDTVQYRQVFGDYYAYDDGTSENGYNLTSTSSTIYLAYRFDLNQTDTLTAVDLFFNATLDSANTRIPFYLTLWNVGGNGKPDEELYRDQVRRFPQTGVWHRYVLEEPVTVSGGGLFVGFEQSGNDFINVGFDRSLNTSSRIYYFTDSIWRQSFLSGSLMLRPCFGAAAALGIGEQDVEQVEWNLYPNPANDKVYIDGMVDKLELYDMQGRRLATSRGNVLELSDIPDGLYLLRVLSGSGAPHAAKLIIRH